MTCRISLVAFAVVTLAALPALARPNYSGEWKLNTSKSSFGQAPAPSSMTTKIAHQEPKLETNTKASGDQGDMEFHANYTTDGKECTNELMGNPIKSTVKWDGDVLVINSNASFGGNEMTILDRWILSEDGKTLTINRVYKSAMGDMDVKLIMEKQ